METNTLESSRMFYLVDKVHILGPTEKSTRDSLSMVKETDSGLKLMLMEANMLESSMMVYLVEKVHKLGPTETGTRDSISMVK
jgi:hypothetical protein